MKIGGVEVKGPGTEILVLPRAQSEDIVFTCQAVLDMKQFEALCPEPKAGKIMMGGTKKFTDNVNDPGYIQQMKDHATRRFSYIALKSLEPSDIEWETVEIEKPATWENWEKELKEAGLSVIEVNRVTVAIMRANSLDEEMLVRARATFLHGLEEVQGKSSGPLTEPKST